MYFPHGHISKWINTSTKLLRYPNESHSFSLSPIFRTYKQWNEQTFFASSSNFSGFSLFVRSNAMLAPLCKNKNEPFSRLWSCSKMTFILYSEISFDITDGHRLVHLHGIHRLMLLFFSFSHRIAVSIQVILNGAWQVGKTHRNNNIIILSILN